MKAQTRQRMDHEARVLCIADGTTLDYHGLAECDGLGVIGSNQTGATSRGIKLHSTLAVNAMGIPLGIVDVRCRLPQDDAPKSTVATPIEDKTSFDWISSLRSCTALAEKVIISAIAFFSSVVQDQRDKSYTFSDKGIYELSQHI